MNCKARRTLQKAIDPYIVTLRLVATTDSYPVALPLTSTSASPLQLPGSLPNSSFSSNSWNGIGVPSWRSLPKSTDLARIGAGTF